MLSNTICTIVNRDNKCVFFSFPCKCAADRLTGDTLRIQWNSVDWDSFSTSAIILQLLFVIKFCFGPFETKHSQQWQASADFSLLLCAVIWIVWAVCLPMRMELSWVSFALPLFEVGDSKFVLIAIRWWNNKLERKVLWLCDTFANVWRAPESMWCERISKKLATMNRRRANELCTEYTIWGRPCAHYDKTFPTGTYWHCYKLCDYYCCH